MSFEARLKSAMGLLRRTQRLAFAMLIAGRILMGFCDLLLAAAMYMLFILLQGGSNATHNWWSPRSILSASIFTVVIVVVRVLLDLALSRSTIRFTQVLYGDFLGRLVEGYSEMLWTHFVQRNRSEMLKHAVTTSLDASYSYQLLCEAASGTVVIAALAIALIYKSPLLALCLALVMIPLYLLHRYGVRDRLNAAAAKRERALRDLQKTVSETLAAGKEIRTYANAEFFYSHLRAHVATVTENNLHLGLLPQATRVLAEQGAVLLFLGILIVVQLSHGDIKQLLSILVFYFVLSRRLLPMLSSLSLTFGQLEGAYENLMTITTELSDCARFRCIDLVAEKPGSGYVLDLHDIRFCYLPEHGKERILNGLDLSMEAGQIVVLQGASGAGKSTLLNVIAGVLPPDSGTIRVDRTRVAYVPQEIALLDESIRANLLFGLPSISDAKLMEALAAVNLLSLIRSLPAGLETRTGDDGILFSGGQRQRLGLARAILRDVSLLLLDEATSALDEKNERDVLENLSRLKIAILLVRHRSHSTNFAHRLYSLQDGVLVDSTSTLSALKDEPVSLA